MQAVANINWVPLTSASLPLMLVMIAVSIPLSRLYRARRRGAKFSSRMAERIQRAAVRGEDGVPDLLLILKAGPDAQTLLAVVRALQRIGAAGAVGAVAIIIAYRQRLRKKVPELKQGILEAFAVWGEKAAWAEPLIRRVMTSNIKAEREFAAEALRCIHAAE